MEILTLKTNSIIAVTTKVSSSNTEYSIVANVAVQDGKVNHFENGEVRKTDGTTVANFADYGNLSLNFTAQLTADEQTAILSLINAFESSAKSANIESLTTIIA